MKTMLLALTILLFAASNHCFALRVFGFLSKQEAKEMGIQIRATAAGPDAAWVELEFKTEGKLKNFSPESGSLVELEIKEGEKSLLTAALQMKQPSRGHIVVSFVANRAQLDKMTLAVVVGQGAAAGGASILRVKEFVELEKIR